MFRERLLFLDFFQPLNFLPSNNHNSRSLCIFGGNLIMQSDSSVGDIQTCVVHKCIANISCLFFMVTGTISCMFIKRGGQANSDKFQRVKKKKTTPSYTKATEVTCKYRLLSKKNNKYLLGIPLDHLTW